MTFPLSEPVAKWSPGDFSQTGINFIVDPNGNFIVDPSNNKIVDTGVLQTTAPDSVWTPNDELNGNITSWQTGEFSEVASLSLTDNNNNFIVTNNGNFIVTNPVLDTPDPVTVWTPSDGTQ